MSKSLRYYQDEANAATFEYWKANGGNPLVELATGTGKSLVQSALCKQILEKWPETNILALCHVKELIQQNADEMREYWPEAPIGVNCAGLNRRDKHQKILFASIQSVARETPSSLGERHVILVDECHLIPAKGNGQYLKLLERFREAVPGLRVCGFTATPYRLDSGLLTEGSDRIFDDIVYSYDIARGVADGYLSPLVARATKERLNTSGVGMRGGDFIAGALEQAVNTEAITNAACDEIVAKGADRKSWLAFCCGVKHAQAVQQALVERGIKAATIHANTPSGERDLLLEMFKRGEIRCLTNANVLTTGFNAPGTDMIAMLRPTMSTSLYVQMLGRGSRLAPNKGDCLVLDFAGNVRTHGPVDDVSVTVKKTGGKASAGGNLTKDCPSCDAIIARHLRECPVCAHEFTVERVPNHNARSDAGVTVMSGADKKPVAKNDDWIPISRVNSYRHVKQDGKQSVRVEYVAGMRVFKEWLAFEQGGFPQAKAEQWWGKLINTNTPATISEAIMRLHTESRIEAIRTVQNGAYFNIVGWRVRYNETKVFEFDKWLNSKLVDLPKIARAS
jgi:DNA repair protein RadD